MEERTFERRESRLRRLILLFCISVFFFAGCAEKKQEKNSSFTKVTKEKEAYLNHCANCHGGNLEGSFGPPLNEIEKKYKEKEILKIIQKGKGNMPAQDYISRKEQEELAKWLSKK